MQPLYRFFVKKKEKKCISKSGLKSPLKGKNKKYMEKKKKKMCRYTEYLLKRFSKRRIALYE